MRILQISSSRTYGGGERHFVDLCRGLQGAGHDVFAALRPTNVWQDRLDFLPKESIFHVSIRNSFGILSATRIASFAREKGVQIIHAHVARDYIPASIAASLAGDARFVLTRHVVFPLKPFNRFALKNLSKAIAVSSGVERTLRSLFPAEKVVLVANGIDVSSRDADELARMRREFLDFHGLPAETQLVGTIGELTPLKGQGDLILAANELVRDFPSLRFVIVGRDNTIDQRHRRELKRLTKVMQLEDKFIWLDWVEDTEPLFAALSVFVSASHTESFGMALLEAMARGVPIVATDTDGSRELLGEEYDRAPVAKPLELASRISALLSDSVRREAEVARLKRAASDRYSLDRMIVQTGQLYEGLLKKTSE